MSGGGGALLGVSPVPVAVVGCGHMGRLHARTVCASPRARLVSLVDRTPDKARSLAAELGVHAPASAIAQAALVVVATSTLGHVEVARPHLRAGRWCLVEKPLAPTARQAAALDPRRVIAAHIERFNPAWSPPEPGWTRLEIARRGPSSGRSVDIDVVADLMLHDLDLLQHVGLPMPVVCARSAVRGPGGALDEVEVALGWGDGRVAIVRASRRAAAVERRWVIDGPSGRSIHDLAARPAHGPDALTRQLHAALDAVVGDRPTPVPASEGVAALAWVEAIRAACG